MNHYRVVGDEQTGDAWRLDVTDEDIRLARLAWLASRDASIPDNIRTARLREILRRLMHGQAQQIADDFRAKRSE